MHPIFSFRNSRGCEFLKRFVLWRVRTIVSAVLGSNDNKLAVRPCFGENLDRVGKRIKATKRLKAPIHICYNLVCASKHNAIGKNETSVMIRSEFIRIDSIMNYSYFVTIRFWM